MSLAGGHLVSARKGEVGQATQHLGESSVVGAQDALVDGHRLLQRRLCGRGISQFKHELAVALQRRSGRDDLARTSPARCPRLRRRCRLASSTCPALRCKRPRLLRTGMSCTSSGSRAFSRMPSARSCNTRDVSVSPDTSLITARLFKLTAMAGSFGSCGSQEHAEVSGRRRRCDPPGASPGCSGSVRRSWRAGRSADSAPWATRENHSAINGNMGTAQTSRMPRTPPSYTNSERPRRAREGG